MHWCLVKKSYFHGVYCTLPGSIGNNLHIVVVGLKKREMDTKLSHTVAHVIHRALGKFLYSWVTWPLTSWRVARKYLHISYGSWKQDKRWKWSDLQVSLFDWLGDYVYFGKSEENANIGGLICSDWFDILCVCHFCTGCEIFYLQRTITYCNTMECNNRHNRNQLSAKSHQKKKPHLSWDNFSKMFLGICWKARKIKFDICFTSEGYSMLQLPIIDQPWNVPKTSSPYLWISNNPCFSYELKQRQDNSTNGG